MIKSALKLNSNHRRVSITLAVISFLFLALFLTPSSSYAGYSPVTNIDNGNNNFSAQLDAYQRNVTYVKMTGESVWTGTGYVYTYIGDIYLYQKSTGSAALITAPAGDADQRHPSIWGSRIVWQDGRNADIPKYPNSGNGNYDIYLNEIGGSTYQLTTSTAKQVQPDIFGNYVVWLDARDGGGNNYDVYLYDLSVDSNNNGIPNYRESSRPNPDPALKRLTTSSSAYIDEPRVYGHRVVWSQGSGDIYSIYSYDLNTSTLTRLASGVTGKPRLSIYRDKVIWLDNSSHDVYMYDFNSPGPPTHVLNDSADLLTTPSLWGNKFALGVDAVDSGFNILYSQTKIYNLSGSLIWQTASVSGTFDKSPTLLGNPGAGTGLVAWAQDTLSPEAYDNNIKAAGISDSDSAAPTPPTAVLAAAAGIGGGTLDITWTHSASADTAGYKLSWGTSPGVYTDSVDVYDVNEYKLTGLTNGQTYYVALKAYDTSNNLSGYSSESSGAPSPADTTSPAVTGTAPTNTAADISVDTTVSAVFSEAVDTPTINNTTVYLNRQGSTTTIPAVVSTDSSATAVYLKPNQALSYDTTYTATLMTGITDIAGNHMASNYTFSFKTRALNTYEEPLAMFEGAWIDAPHPLASGGGLKLARSEERRVGKECRSRWSPYH